MKNLPILRLFIAFPLIGIAIPDFAFICDDTHYHIPTWHFVAFLILVVVLLGTYVLKQENTSDKNTLI